MEVGLAHGNDCLVFFGPAEGLVDELVVREEQISFRLGNTPEVNIVSLVGRGGWSDLVGEHEAAYSFEEVLILGDAFR
jgi:hypothetical protein